MSIGIALGLAVALVAGAGKVVPGPPPLPPARAFSVAPGLGGTPLTSWPRGGAPRLLWTGFQVTDSGSRVFVQVTRDVQVDMQPTDDGLSITLRKCRIHMRNNRRRLDTRFFATPVKSISVRQRRGGVELFIALREAATAKPRKEAGPGGSQFWMLDFAPSRSAGAGPPFPKVSPPS